MNEQIENDTAAPENDVSLLEELVHDCQMVMAHAWMVRTFVKHSDESEDFPELMGIARSVFDTSRALETRVDDPAAYFKMLSKKIGKLEKATRQFAVDAPEASTHTNFQQAVLSMQTCCRDLRSLMERGQQELKKAV
ncbi:amidohydrolase [Rubinisphaera margarita]|uniref:amidohydrolase n=1 Tax=Rubinisphaera margarita TaxID=2909586 RepID=UPI001EE96D8B|nr:amidohydrolase [Rubinisphaera margarita]MCG6157837.1 amidohydrolase [Rubinisphaera margarita]